MKSCKQMTHLLSEKLDRPLSAAERMALRFHLMMCSGCRNFNRNMQFMHQLCERAGGREQPFS